MDVTSSNAVLSLFGPKARDILQLVTLKAMSLDNGPSVWIWHVRSVSQGCPVLALRITYVGELGWELHLPVEYAQTSL
jgi:4-methylaminobutanoate oxidase (formaldehyde-forming)